MLKHLFPFLPHSLSPFHLPTVLFTMAIILWAVILSASFSVVSAVDPIHLPLRYTQRSHESLSRRALPNSVPLYNALMQGAYAIDLSIGTPGTKCDFLRWKMKGRLAHPFLGPRLCQPTNVSILSGCVFSGQNFSVIVDTGSTELWVPGPSCPETECFSTLFNPQASTTFVATTDPINLIYGVGSDNGTYGRDTVTLGGYQVQNLTFGVISSAANNSIPVSGEPYLNGILGLAFPTLTYAYKTRKAEYDPFVFALWKQNQIPQPIFSIYLGPRTATGETGLVTFGGIDNTKFSGNLQWLQVQMETYPNMTADYYHWNLLVVGLSATINGKQSSNLLATAGEVVALDTGTTLSYMPQHVVVNMLKVIAPNAIYVQGIYIVDCSLASSTGTVDFAFGNATGSSNATILSVPISSLVLPADSISLSTAQNCLWGIVPIDINALGTYLLGDTFLQSVYVVHDFENHVVGMASAAWTNLTSSSNIATTPASSSGSTNNGGSNSGSPITSGSAAALHPITGFALAACVCLLLL
jgi:Eukaryotic aspartyl protease